MHRTREILRQKWALTRSHREVAASVGVVGKTVIRARAAGLDWEGLQKLDDAQLDLSTRFCRWWATSRARARPTSRAPT